MKYLKSWSGFYDHIVMNCKDIFIDNSVDDIHFFISYIEHSSDIINFKFKDGDTISMKPGKFAIKEIKLFFNS